MKKSAMSLLASALDKTKPSHEDLLSRPAAEMGACYLQKNKDVIPVYGMNFERAWEHYARHGHSEGRKWGCTPGQKSQNEKDGMCYYEAYPDVEKVYGPDPLRAAQHYMDHGYGEGREWGCLTDPSRQAKCYMDRYADVASHEAYKDHPDGAFTHYRDFGKKEGRTWGCVDKSTPSPGVDNTPSSEEQTTDEKNMTTVYIGVGVSLGVILLFAIIIGLVMYRRRST